MLFSETPPFPSHPHPPSTGSTSLPRTVPTQHEWSPYEDNGGSVIAIGGPGFVVVGADTRLSEGYTIFTREDDSKVTVLTPQCLLASTGMQADRVALSHTLRENLQWYRFNHRQVAGTRAISQMLSNQLYYRRFFPLYTFNVLAGLDEHGDGVCFSYDAVGCTEPLRYGSTGSGHTLIEPLLDNQIRRAHQGNGGEGEMTVDQAVGLIKEAFTGACERDIYCGDYVNVYVLTKEGGLSTQRVDLRKD